MSEACVTGIFGQRIDELGFSGQGIFLPGYLE